ncbi:MAG: 16S rRNA (adenine(1518)-N(6)/adenine(1519)-N(6))-dimethyltransferase RsmA [Candidatus Lernaella stagnicola]|nr:16S rRNA (adenine(1518)-N(6)/adenine(1519)-N(6))-dimethyltransferase RsmA [Candidatus Lernaella stagnicola]
MSDSPSIPPKKSLGQNFLIDKNLAAKIVRALPVVPGDTVLEIGPGTGALTEHLADLVPSLVAVEIDARLLPGLQERFGDRVQFVHDDILHVDLTKLAKTRGGRLQVIGNLPYYSSSPILFHLLAHREHVHHAVLTLQEEVVARCCAGPGTKSYGTLSVQLALFAKPRKLFALPPHVFRPAPKVRSAVLALDFQSPETSLPRRYDDFETVLRAAFAQRRKTVRNSLSSRLGAETAVAILAAADIDGGARAESLMPTRFTALADALTALRKT